MTASPTGGRSLRPWDALRHAAVVAGLTYLVLVWLGVIDYPAPYLPYGPMADAHAYWAAPASDPYASSDVGVVDAFLYSPAFAQLVLPLKALPFHVFYGVVVAASLGALFYLRIPYVVAFPPVMDDPVRGNIHVLLMATIVIGLRHSWAWAAILLTKVTPGIGLLWFAVRREWGSLALALGASAAIAAVSFVLAPDWWPAWFASLSGNAGAPLPIGAVPVPFVVRIGPAIALIVFAALTSRRWLVPIGCCLALPVIWPGGLTLLAGAIPLWRARARRAAPAPDTGAAGREPALDPAV